MNYGQKFIHKNVSWSLVFNSKEFIKPKISQNSGGGVFLSGVNIVSVVKISYGILM